MAVSEPLAYSGAIEDAPLRLSRVAGWMGAMTSVALVGGLVWWTADIAMRDARAVPVVRAMDGPARVAPADPGGFEAAHQGYAVNRIASEKTDAPLSERVVLAPEPTGLAPEDIAAQDTVRAGASTEDALRSAVGAALLEAIGGEVGTASPPQQVGAPASPRPRQRPELELATRAVVTQASFGMPLDRPEEIAAAGIPAGTRLVQLGAYDSRDAALADWARLSAKFGNYMSDKSRVVEQAVMADGTVWRLRAHGFNSLSDARSFCAVLVSAQADCIPVLTR
ncbi:MAG: SPOR domain-containing protein [Qingshengfaniella sp.]